MHILNMNHITYIDIIHTQEILNVFTWIVLIIHILRYEWKSILII